MLAGTSGRHGEKKRLPSPSVLSTQMRPPCNSTIRLVIVKPNPAPSLMLWMAGVTCMNSSKMAVCWAGGIPIPRIAHAKADLSVIRFGSQVHAAAGRRKLDRIAQQVIQNLLKSFSITIREERGGYLAADFDTFDFSQGFRDGKDFRGGIRCGKLLMAQIDPPGFDSVKPMMEFSGVRNSWLMRARNSLFILLARASSSFCFANRLFASVS